MRNPFVHKQSFNRTNLTYSVRKKESKTIIKDVPSYHDFNYCIYLISISPNLIDCVFNLFHR